MAASSGTDHRAELPGHTEVELPGPGWAVNWTAHKAGQPERIEAGPTVHRAEPPERTGAGLIDHRAGLPVLACHHCNRACGSEHPQRGRRSEL